MGISGLLPLFKSIQRPVHISALAGQWVAVDAYVWLHRGVYGCAADIGLSKPTQRHVDYCMFRVRMLKHYGVKPLVVFDGAALPAKAGTEEQRAQSRAENREKANKLHQAGQTSLAYNYFTRSIDITPQMAHQFIEELRKEDVKYVVAPYEADAQLAHLARTGAVSAVITEDSDMLVFGCPRIIFKMDQSGNGTEIVREQWTSTTNINLSGWTDSDFRRWCILAGCDYLKSLPRMGIKTAHRYIRMYKTLDALLDGIARAGFPVDDEYRKAFRDAELTFLHQRVYDIQRQELVHLTPLSTKTALADTNFLGADIPRDTAKSIAEGRLDPITRQPYTRTARPTKVWVKSNSPHNWAPNTTRQVIKIGQNASWKATSTARNAAATTTTTTTTVSYTSTQSKLFQQRSSTVRSSSAVTSTTVSEAIQEVATSTAQTSPYFKRATTTTTTNAGIVQHIMLRSRSASSISSSSTELETTTTRSPSAATSPSASRTECQLVEVSVNTPPDTTATTEVDKASKATITTTSTVRDSQEDEDDLEEVATPSGHKRFYSDRSESYSSDGNGSPSILQRPATPTRPRKRSQAQRSPSPATAHVQSAMYSTCASTLRERSLTVGVIRAGATRLGSATTTVATATSRYKRPRTIVTQTLLPFTRTSAATAVTAGISSDASTSETTLASSEGSTESTSRPLSDSPPSSPVY